MAVMELWRRRDLEGAVKTEYVDGNFFNQDNAGNRVGVKVYKDGAEVALTGSVTGYCVLPSGETVSVAGTRSGNQASILVPQSALAYTGPLGITLKLVDGNTITTLMSIIVVVYRSKTDTVITPSSQIITDWANQISAALQEVEDASAAQDVKIADLKSAIVKYNSFDLLDGIPVSKNDTTYRGIAFAWDAEKTNCSVSGTATGLCLYILNESLSSVPSPFEAGKSYNLTYQTDNSDIIFQVLTYLNGDQSNPSVQMFVSDGVFTIPSDCTGLTFRLRIASGVTISNATISVAVMNALSNDDLDSKIDSTNDLINSLFVLNKNKQLLDLSEVVDGYFYNTSGELRTAASFCYQTNIVPSGRTVAISGGRHITCYFDLNGNVVAGGADVTADEVRTLPYNVAYIAVSFPIANKAKMVIADSDEILSKGEIYNGLNIDVDVPQVIRETVLTIGTDYANLRAALEYILTQDTSYYNRFVVRIPAGTYDIKS